MLEDKNIFKQEKIMLQLTFNPGLTLTGFQTTRPWSVRPGSSSKSGIYFITWLNHVEAYLRPCNGHLLNYAKSNLRGKLANFLL